MEVREPRAPSIAVGVGRGRTIASSASSVISSTSACAGRGAVLQAVHEERRQMDMDMANAQRPYEQFLVIVCCSFAFTLGLTFRLV